MYLHSQYNKVCSPFYTNKKPFVFYYYPILGYDDYNTWWNDGRSYLCRIIDMLHMGYVDEVLFGVEVVERLPLLAKKWVEIAHQNPELVKPPLQ